MNARLPILLPVALFAALCGCSPYPKDAADSTSLAMQSGIRVGASHDPPFVVVGPDGDVSGCDAEVVQRFARANDLQVEWVVGGHDPLMAQLEAVSLHLVVGGHAPESPWQPLVGWSAEVPVRSEGRSPFPGRRVAVPPGENALHLMLDRYLVAHEGAK